MMGRRFVATFADTPLLFFGVVLGLALVFRLGVGVAREATKPEEVAPIFVTGTEPRPAASHDTKLQADPLASPLPGAATPSAVVGAAAKVQPLGAHPGASPPPARVAPRPRGHGRRPFRGER